MSDTLTLRRFLGFGATALAVGVGAFALLSGTGTRPAPTVALATLAALFALVVAPLIALARRVGAEADDHEEIERRIAAGLGMSKAEFDASFEDGGRQGYRERREGHGDREE